MVEQTRQQRFVRSLRDWGCVFMLAVWLQSIMASAIASKSSGDGSHGGGFLKTRNDLMKENMAAVWSGFKSEFPGQITEQEELTADMIILLRNQLAHCFISSGKELALFLPTSSQKHLDRLNRAGWIEVPDDAASDPAMLVLREGDAKLSGELASAAFTLVRCARLAPRSSTAGRDQESPAAAFRRQRAAEHATEPARQPAGRHGAVRGVSPWPRCERTLVAAATDGDGVPVDGGCRA